jgi:hypothetical protein
VADAQAFRTGDKLVYTRTGEVEQSPAKEKTGDMLGEVDGNETGGEPAHPGIEKANAALIDASAVSDSSGRTRTRSCCFGQG